jgi:KDO2-lipid IV(A) lauroyltransferase
VAVEKNYGSAPFIAVSMRLAQSLPRSVGRLLARQCAWLLARLQIRPYRILRENLSHVVRDLSPQELERLARRAARELAYTYVDMFRISQQDLLHGDVMLHDAEEWERVQAHFRDKRGTVVVGGHVGNFDLAAQWIGGQGHQVQMLGLADPGKATEIINAYRQQDAIVVTPISVQALREAVRRLRSGGVVATGVDRPASYDDPPIQFFQAPAPLPTGHVRLAMQTGACIVVAYCLRQADGRYRIRFFPALDMIRTGDREADVLLNARRVLELIEQTILEDPAQWGMLHPVWSVPPEPNPAS